MNTAIVEFTGTSPYSQGKYIATEKKRGEKHDVFEKRTWRERMPIDESTGAVMLSPMAVKRALEDAAKFSGLTIPGKGKATYTKRLLSGIMVVNPIQLCEPGTEIQGEWLHVPSDGVRGGGKRVMKCFPYIMDWGGVAEIAVFDEAVTEDIMREFCEIAGRFIGFGRFRPQNGGYYGRFDVTGFEWK
jgi:hypothetical protein